jgi:hypothetical protein
MTKTRVWIAMGCCLFAVALAAWAQGGRKPGLWEITTTMNYQSQAGATGRPATVGPYTTPACLTQALIDKYGAPLPQVGQCKITSVNKQANSVKAILACTGRMNGTATMESTWTATTATGSVHFVMSPPPGSAAKAVEWTSTSTSVFKSADCGSVKPFPMPN